MATPWYSYPVTQGFGQRGEKGVDLGTPFHTPITALFAGTVRFAGRTQWACGSSGGEVTIVCNLPGQGLMTSYYLHLDSTSVKVNDTVRQGQVIGLSGGQLSGGQWPVINCPQKGDIYSDGPHTEFGFNAPWVSGPGKNIDPTSYILAARSGRLPISLPDGTSTAPVGSIGGSGPVVQVNTPTIVEQSLAALYTLSSVTHKTITQPSGWDGMCESLDYIEQLPPFNWWNPFGSILADLPGLLIRAFGILIGLLIIFMVLRGPISSVTNRVQTVLSAQDITGGAGAASTLAAAPEVAAL